METPVIASRLGVLPERVREGVDGFLFTAGDAAALRTLLHHLSHHPESIQGLRQGIQPVFTIAEHIAQVEEVYEQVWVAPLSRLWPVS